jgi:hypothetical protein
MMSGGRRGTIPQEVTREADVLPHQWRGVGKQFIRHRPPESSHVVEGVSHIGRPATITFLENVFGLSPRELVR